ncbi:MAG: signal peptidase I [Huintestinicola sp.]|uniref:signal peptidase I n=1 Tax=Huintestinicola sp. TaxID=2981661 RepID=UPI003EFEDBC0
MAKKRNKKSSAVNIIEGVVIGILIILIAGMLFLYFSFSDNGAAPNIFGYTFYHTKAVKMEPKIPQNTVVIGKTGDLENIKVGSVVVCKIGEDTVLTRVVQLISENGEMSYVVKFDTAPANDTFKIPAENIIAKATSQSSIFGSVLNFATSTFGIMLVIIIPSFIIIVFQVIRIVNVKRTQEEAVSLDELDEIMTNDDEDGHDFFEEPASFSTPEPEPEPVPVQEKTVLSVDKNGKAGLSAVREEGTPLFTYDGFAGNKNKRPETKQGSSVVKPVKTPHTDRFFSEYASEEEKAPLYENKAEQPAAEEEKSVDFMSGVIPQSIAEAAAKAEIPAEENSPEPVKTYEPKAVREDKIVKEARNIPEQAVIPKEKLAPPKKKNNSKAISELMSIIDAEESKLKK